MDEETSAAWVGQPMMKNSILLSSQLGDNCHGDNQQLDPSLQERVGVRLKSGSLRHTMRAELGAVFGLDHTVM